MPYGINALNFLSDRVTNIRPSIQLSLETMIVYKYDKICLDIEVTRVSDRVNLRKLIVVNISMTV